jgi:cytochrome oxidase Cu insertion factor (SCO1/SenC/PrrC family)
MRRIVASAIGVGAVSAAAAVLAGCGGSSYAGPAAIGPPPGLYRGSEPPPGIHAPGFALRSYRGPVVQMRDLRDRVVLVTFLDTACREKCPVIAAEIGMAIPLLTPAERARVDALAITVLPRVDTPLRIRRFLRQRHALGRLDWLIGPVDELPGVWKAFHILAAEQTGNADVHSADVRVFDPRGIWVSTLHAGVDLTPVNLAHDIRVALRNAH